MTPRLRQVVLDTTDARGLAEFYRHLLGWNYGPGHEPPTDGPDDTDWIVLRDPESGSRLAFQLTDNIQPSTWPEQGVPQQLHLDLDVASPDELASEHRRALALGAQLLLDRSADPEEQLYVYADPSGHPFCIFLAPDRMSTPPPPAG